MSNQQSSMVHLFGGKMASAKELEAYLTGCYDEDGEYVPSVFEEEFELDLTQISWKWNGLRKLVLICKACYQDFLMTIN